MWLMMWLEMRMMRGDQHRSTVAEQSDQQARLRGQLHEFQVLRDHGSVEGDGDRRVIGHSSR